jgi:hypothetical protein
VHQVHHLELTVTGDAAVLGRIAGLCRARRCEVVFLRFRAADRHRPGAVSLSFAADARRARLVTARLAALVEVTAVEGEAAVPAAVPAAATAAR